jgi:hypothetical protein
MKHMWTHQPEMCGGIGTIFIQFQDQSIFSVYIFFFGGDRPFLVTSSHIFIGKRPILGGETSHISWSKFNLMS